MEKSRVLPFFFPRLTSSAYRQAGSEVACSLIFLTEKMFSLLDLPLLFSHYLRQNKNTELCLLGWLIRGSPKLEVF